jgi:dimethylargininase
MSGHVTPIVALTRGVPSSLAHCELTHLIREPIDIARAELQHAQYEAMLESLGCTLQRLPAVPDLPDSIFVEDTAIVLPELAIVTRPGAESRRGEIESVADALREYREVATIDTPATIDGGDVLVLGKSIYVGQSTRTNAAAVEQLRKLTAPFGYRVVPAKVTGCLHLKSAVSGVRDGVLLLNPKWIEARVFGDVSVVEVDSREHFGANALRVNDSVIYPRAFPRTRDRLESAGVDVHPVDVDELAKAEAGVTCCSILIRS